MILTYRIKNLCKTIFDLENYIIIIRRKKRCNQKNISNAIQINGNILAHLIIFMEWLNAQRNTSTSNTNIKFKKDNEIRRRSKRKNAEKIKLDIACNMIWHIEHVTHTLEHHESIDLCTKLYQFYN